MPLLSFLRFSRVSLQIRITVLVVVIVLITTLAITAAAQYILKQGMKEAIGTEQFARLTNIASAIDQKFGSRKTLLKLFSEGISADMLGNPAQLQEHLIHYTALRDSFDSVSILNRAGDVVANLNGMNNLGKVNVSDRLYFTDTLSTNQSVISKPLVNRVSLKPQVIMTQPVRDATGMVIYVISGGIDLQEPKFLGEFTNMKFGKTGYLFIVDTDGTIVDHPKKDRILKHVGVDGTYNVSTKMALAGFEGSTEALNTYGIYGLYSFKRIESTNWILGSIYPESEAFAPIDEVRRKSLAASLILSLLAGIAVWWSTRLQLIPLHQLRRHMKTAREQPEYVPRQVEYKNDEIGDLGIAFDQLMQDRESAIVGSRESEQHMRSILAHAGDAFVGCDVAGYIVEWNQQAQDTFGWSRSEAIGKQLATLIVPPSKRAEHAVVMEHFVSTGEGPIVNKRVQVTALRKDGREIPIELMVAAVRSDAGYTANAFMRDISDRLLAEEKLATSEKRLRMITDNLPALIAYIDQEGRYRFANAFYKTRLRFDPQQMVGKTVLEVYGEENYKLIAEGVGKALQGESVHFERRQVVQGTVSHLSVDYIPDISPDGTVVGLYVMGLDITARKQAELKQAESEERLRTIADNLPAQIAFIDSKERYLFVNAALATIAGYPPDEMIGKIMRDVCGPELYAFLAPYIATVLSGESVTFQGEAKWQGKAHYYESIYIPAKTADGDVSGFYAMTFDITDRKKIEAIKNEFISTVSHELRTPLTSINGALGLVIAGVVGEAPPKIKELMLVARRNVERLIRMINDMLDIEKIESGSMIFDIQAHNLVPLIEHALDSSQAYALQYGVSIKFDIYELDAVSNIDQDRFTQVIINLLSNAIKFSDVGGAVTVALHKAQDVWRVTVSNQGCGIPEEFHDRVFQKFSQVDGANSRKKGGSGLGLSICKPIIEQMGGAIGFISAAGEGATFYVTLPVA